ncbi:hypothetical protein QNI16_01945 [Cytophagaceae bacterium YF14B1]|uniref:Lipoprotein n=1 Tax=Xanthocytophaga flava TaxID=3048013 RepID=A0AAE3QIG1_9BACT|nr:hypothetical protein [Xanthocytophaga flavus]MDJ1479226.1 hypothetical protein [Xanthocytophaga flavus]
MKNLFVAAAIVLGTIAFSACDSKPAAETEATEAVDSVKDAATETIDSTADAAKDSIEAKADSTH